VALSVLYVAFVRLLELLRLSKRREGELAVEVVMLRHEVAVAARSLAPLCVHRTAPSWPG